MKNPLIVSCAAFVLSAVGIAMVLMNGLSGGADGRDTDRPAAAVPEVDLLARVDALAGENRALRGRLSALELIPAAPTRAPAAGYVTTEEFQAFRDEVLAALSTQAPEVAAKAPQFNEQVAEALETIQRDQAYTQAFEDYEKRTSSLDQRVHMWSNWLGLDEVQQGQLTDLMSERDEREREYLHAWEGGADDEGLEEMRRGFQQDHFRAIREILTPEQEDRMGDKFGDGEDDEG